ncbi:MAG: hypothetical protein ING30_06150 [Burkholderiales bacterium]|jgi:hypothetical protein|nr:hypothetical protein [Rhodocyclaceae bacterium]MCA3107643.1 hypothetical protein [Rhodocyclaceae bacterium]MCA3154603.1 hypothetical protein [Burkholderiales bacterium]MCE2981833.1 hypothetical protein [Betaproteobacteria bacterium]
MNAVDTLEIAKGAFERVREAFPSLEVVEDTATQVDVSLDIPVQPGMKHHVHLNLQNIDELHFNVGSFRLAWFPCTDSANVEYYVEAVTGFISGRLRVLEHYRGKRCIKAELQAPANGGWNTIGTTTRLSLPIPSRIEQRVISNA